MPQDLTPPDPSVVLDLMDGFRRSKTMFAAMSLGVFDALASGPKPLTELAQELSASPEALERLVDACVGLRLLNKQSGRYENTPSATAYLTKTSPARLTGYINYSNDVLWKLWANLEGAVREGTHRWQETFGWDGPIFSHFFRDDWSKREFLMGMHGMGLLSSPHVVSAFDLSRFSRLVDAGGATGHLAIAACKRYPKLHAVVFELPDALPLAKEIISASGVADRIELVAGDFFNDPLPEADLFALGRIVHDWSDAKAAKLLGRIHERLPRDGALLIAERLLLDDKSGPTPAQMQSLNMLTCTEGKERSLAEYEALLHPLGFREVLGRRTGSTLDAVLALA